MITINEKTENLIIDDKNFTFYRTKVEKPLSKNQKSFYPRKVECKIFDSENEKNEYLVAVLN